MQEFQIPEMTHTLKKCFGTSDSEAFFISLNINTIQTQPSSLQVFYDKKMAEKFGQSGNNV